MYIYIYIYVYIYRDRYIYKYYIMIGTYNNHKKQQRVQETNLYGLVLHCPSSQFRGIGFGNQYTKCFMRSLSPGLKCERSPIWHLMVEPTKNSQLEFIILSRDAKQNLQHLNSHKHSGWLVDNQFNKIQMRSNSVLISTNPLVTHHQKLIPSSQY